MAPHTEPVKHSSKIAALQGTPTRTMKNSASAESPKYPFTFRREQSLELSPEAKKLMNEKREEAMKIREQMVSSGEGAKDAAATLGRRIATPKGKKGRFSEVHMEEFKKMDSIANHPSAWRAAALKNKTPEAPVQIQTASQKASKTASSSVKSLKRSPSKAELDASPHPQQRSLHRSPSKPSLKQQQPSSNIPQSPSKKTLQQDDELETSPAKRVKPSIHDDSSAVRPISNGQTQPQPMTPVVKKVHIVSPHVSTLASPTEASLARTTSFKTSQIPGPGLSRSPSKPSLLQQQESKPDTPLLARSPSKSSLFAVHSAQKGNTVKGTTDALLLRSPAKHGGAAKAQETEGETARRVPEVALLSRTPLKASFTKSSETHEHEERASPSTPLLARTPAKIVIDSSQHDQTSKIPGKSTGTNLFSRFNLLRASPVKSILRSPQRLFSDDPAKIAAGTHLATPPKRIEDKTKMGLPAGAKTAPVNKRVDFTSSTKDRYERAQSELSSTPSKGSTPIQQSMRSSPPPQAASYPTLPMDSVIATVTPLKRRQTATPADFTFRAGQHDIIFSQSPNAPTSAKSNKRPSTIRHVSAEPQFPSAPVLAPLSTVRKRKFDFENEQAADEEMAIETSDKENAAEVVEERPSKRVKQSEPTPSPQKPAPRRTTLGVKPKKVEGEPKARKSTTTISRARLNALAQPKRRG